MRNCEFSTDDLEAACIALSDSQAPATQRIREALIYLTTEAAVHHFSASRRAPNRMRARISICILPIR